MSQQSVIAVDLGATSGRVVLANWARQSLRPGS